MPCGPLGARHAREDVAVRVSKAAPIVSIIAIRIQAASRHVPDTRPARGMPSNCAQDRSHSSHAQCRYSCVVIDVTTDRDLSTR
jgi:hypothetical protein